MPHTSCLAGRRWDGSRFAVYRSRVLGIAPASPSRLLRCAQRGRCRACGNVIEWYGRPEQAPIGLHPQELAVATVPALCRWHVSAGLAHAQGDGTAWCRIPHLVVCPADEEYLLLNQHLRELRRRLGVRTRRLIDAGAFTPAAAVSAGEGCRSPRAVVQILHRRYMAAGRVEDIRCVALTRTRRRCCLPVADASPTGAWSLLPVASTARQPGNNRLMAVYDLGALPLGEQVRWRAQRCLRHAASSPAADAAPAEWEPFDPCAHAAFITAVPPATGLNRRPGCPGRATGPGGRP